MTTPRDELTDDGAEVRTCAICGHSEGEHRSVSDEPERGRFDLCLTCGERHPFTALVEVGER